MSINVNDKNLGHATAYAYYKAGGGTMTEAEFTEFMADFGTASQTAVEAAQAALASETAARNASTTATNKASEATTAAQTATSKAAEASTSASTATSAKDTAMSASQTATTKAGEATTAAATAVSAKDDAVSANTAAQSAKTAAQTAQTGAETAAASVQSSAAQIATNAEDISQLKSEITDKSDTADMLKAFPTDTASGSVASFADGANVPVKSLIVNIDPVQSGSGDPSPDNVRPISGWSEVNVNVCGINVWDEQWESGSYDSATGEPIAEASRIRTKNPIPVIGGKTYYVKTPNTLGIRYYDINDVFISSGYTATVFNSTSVAPNNAAYLRFTVVGATTYNHDISINYPSTDHDYHPYDGQSINIQLGQTVYGGKLDVTNGVLTIDHKGVDMGSMNWVLQGGEETQFQRFYSGGISTDVSRDNMDSGTMLDLISPIAKAGRNPVYARDEDNRMCALSSTGGFYIVCTAYTTAAEFKTAVTGMMLVYKLATPLTISLTPHEVRSLLGDNNIWADSGDSEVVYRVDPTLYLQRLTEPDADMIADANIVSGQYFMVGNTLYKATANIASGATISPNVNCTRKSLSEALNELNA